MGKLAEGVHNSKRSSSHRSSKAIVRGRHRVVDRNRVRRVAGEVYKVRVSTEGRDARPEASREGPSIGDPPKLVRYPM